MAKKDRGKQMKGARRHEKVVSIRQRALDLFNAGRFSEAVPLYDELLKSFPNDPEGILRLGQIHYRQLRFPQAIALFEQAYAQYPDSVEVRKYLFAAVRDANSLERMLQLAEIFMENPTCETETVLAFLAFATVCDWQRMTQLKDQCIDSLLEDRADGILLPGFCLDVLGMNDVDLETRFALSLKTGEKKKTMFMDRQLKTRFKPPHERLKIGYLSGDFHNHAVGYFCYPIVNAHDTSRFEVFCYSGTHHRDKITTLFEQSAEHFVDVSQLSDRQLAERIYADGVDVLIDLGGHTASSLLNVMFYRPAPVHITYLGFASTTGMCEEVDYRITSHWAEGENAERYYTEKLLYLPDSFVCFGMRPSCNRTTTPPVKNNGYITFGSFNNKRKINPDVVALWSKILKSVPDSKLALKTTWSESVLKNIVRAFMAHDISPDQLILLKFTNGYDDHVDKYNYIDIALDPFPYTGTTTTCEALWMGVPVVTLVQESHASRVSYSILKSMGYEETIAFSEDEYVEKAVALAMNPDGLNLLRSALHTLFEHSVAGKPELFIKSLEDAYLEACRSSKIDLSGLCQDLSILEVQDKLARNPFSSLPGTPKRRGIMVVEKSLVDVRAMVENYLQTVGAPEYMVVVIPAVEGQAELAAFFEQHPPAQEREFCVLKFDDETSFMSHYTLVMDVCSQLYWSASAAGNFGKLIHHEALKRGFRIESHVPQWMMMIDRLSPAIWRMLYSFCTDSNAQEQTKLVIAIPYCEQRQQIASYIGAMIQADGGANRVNLMVNHDEADQEGFLKRVTHLCGHLHVPEKEETALQRMVVELAQTQCLNIVKHDEKPSYAPDPLPPVEDFCVSVVLLTYNRVALLKRAVESVLKQSYHNVILIISDDVSSDGTESYCRQLSEVDSRVVYQRHKVNVGATENFRSALDIAASELIVSLADDDFLMDASIIEKMIQTYRKDPGLGMVFGQCHIGDIHTGISQKTIPGNLTYDCVVDAKQMLLDSVSGNNIFGGGLMLRKSALTRMAEYGTKHWRPMDAFSVLGKEGDYFSGLLEVMCVQVAYLHLPAVFYSMGDETFTSKQLGGGWSIEIRLRLVAFLGDMYRRHFGQDEHLDVRVKNIAAIFDQQLRNIKNELSPKELVLHKKKIQELSSIISSIKKHRFPKALINSSLV
ncbi:MAG: glycosyltransferase [Mariprofundales bacterium]